MTSAKLQLRMAALLLRTKLSLRRRDTTETLRRLLKGGRRWPPFNPDQGLDALKRPARILDANCLAQSIALTVSLERSKRQPELILGCRLYENRRWGAHAWVVVGSEVLDAIPSGVHQPLARLNAGTQWVPAPAPPAS